MIRYNVSWVDDEAVAEVPVAADGGQQRSKWDDPRVPWAGKPRRADILCWAGITLSGIYYYAMLPFRASLLGTHPVLSELLNGTTESVISAAAFARIGHGTVIVALLAAVPGMMKFDVLYWWAGRLWGERVITMLSGKRNRGAKYMDRVHRWGRKFTWPAMIVAPFWVPFVHDGANVGFWHPHAFLQSLILVPVGLVLLPLTLLLVEPLASVCGSQNL